MPAIQPSRVHIGAAGHFWSTYQCVADAAHTPDDILTSDYWSHVAAVRTIRVHDTFEVRCESGEWSAELIVTAVIGKVVRVRPVSVWTAENYNPETAGLSEPAGEGVTVSYKGPALKWCIVRQSDKEMLKQGLASKGDAMREALEYEKIMA